MKPSELIADPKAWTKGVAAVNATGKEVGPSSNEAVAWCLYGACVRCGVWDDQRADRLGELIRKNIGTGTVTDFNDDPNRTHTEVIAILKEAGL